MNAPGDSALRYSEIFGAGFAEDVFSLTPRATRDPSVELAVTHLHQPERPGLPAVILLHGEFGSRQSWYRRDRHCVAVKLLEAGYQVWMPEMRGHGLSPRNQCWSRTTLEDYACLDLPAVQELVRAHYPGKLGWIGVGLHGLALLEGLLTRHLAAIELGQFCLIDLCTPAEVRRELGMGFWESLRARRRGWVRRADVRGERGGEAEPLGLFDEREAIQFAHDLPANAFPPLRYWSLRRQPAASPAVRQLLEHWPGERINQDLRDLAAGSHAPNATLPALLATHFQAATPAAKSNPSPSPLPA